MTKKPYKRGALHRFEKYFIEGNYQKMSFDDLCKEIPDRKPAQIKKHVETLPKDNVKEDKAVQNSKNVTTGDFMAHHQRNGETTGTVMTPAASEMADEFRKTNIPNQKTNPAIHRPKKA